MPARPIPAFVLLALLGFIDPAWGQETAEEPAVPVVTASPGSLFTSHELARARRIAIDNQARRESYVRANEDDDIILLEPYIVEGDSSLLMARLRRELDRPPGAIRASLISEDPEIQRELSLGRRDEYLFFHGPSPGAPRDHVTTGIDLLKAPARIFQAWRDHQVERIFGQPNEITGQ